MNLRFKSKPIFEWWNQFKDVTLQTSIDGITYNAGTTYTSNQSNLDITTLFDGTKDKINFVTKCRKKIFN